MREEPNDGRGDPQGNEINERVAMSNNVTTSPVEPSAEAIAPMSSSSMPSSLSLLSSLSSSATTTPMETIVSSESTRKRTHPEQSPTSAAALALSTLCHTAMMRKATSPSSLSLQSHQHQQPHHPRQVENVTPRPKKLKSIGDPFLPESSWSNAARDSRCANNRSNMLPPTPSCRRHLPSSHESVCRQHNTPTSHPEEHEGKVYPSDDGSHRLHIFVEATRTFASVYPSPSYDNDPQDRSNQAPPNLVTPTSQNSTGPNRATYSRKTKSLGRLCDKFLQTYQQQQQHHHQDDQLQPHSKDTNIVSIDEAAKSLGVERRRIYDIINILDSLHIVRRKCKNTYHWQGTQHLPHVFGKLQHEALQHFSLDAVQHGLLESHHVQNGIDDGDDKSNHDTEKKKKVPKEKKSLGRLSQQFLQLFLVGHTVLSLTDASDKILGTSSEEELAALVQPIAMWGADPAARQAAANRGLKTKIRRLYDIANVFVSLDLIVKLEGESRRAKPTFQWSYHKTAHQIKELYDQHPPDNDNSDSQNDTDCDTPQDDTAEQIPSSTRTPKPQIKTPSSQLYTTNQPTCSTPIASAKFMANIHATGARLSKVTTWNQPEAFARTVSIPSPDHAVAVSSSTLSSPTVTHHNSDNSLSQSSSSTITNEQGTDETPNNELRRTVSISPPSNMTSSPTVPMTPCATTESPP